MSLNKYSTWRSSKPRFFSFYLTPPFGPVHRSRHHDDDDDDDNEDDDDNVDVGRIVDDDDTTTTRMLTKTTTTMAPTKVLFFNISS